MLYDLTSGIEPRPLMMRICCSSWSSLTASAVGLTDFGCCAEAGVTTAKSARSARPASARRQILRKAFMMAPPSGSRRDGFVIGGFPAPGAGTIAALDHAFLVDLGDDLAVTGEQRLGRAHLGAHRQLAFGEAVGAVFLVFLLRAVELRAAGAEGAFVHLAARAEVADLRILRGAERTGVEAVAAADADVLVVQHDRVRR